MSEGEPELEEPLEEPQEATSESEALEQKKRVKKELATIRKRRTSDEKRRFPSATEDYVLLVGIIYGIIYFSGVFLLSTGAFGDDVSNSTWFDRKMSETPLDIADEVCEDKSDTPWIHIYLDNDALALRMRGHNLPSGEPMLNWTFLDSEGALIDTDEGLRKETFFLFGEEPAGTYTAVVVIDILYIPSDGNVSNATTLESFSDELEFTIESEENTWDFLPWADSQEKKEAKVTESGPRPCWSAQDLGNWGWGLMIAELGGGRETAMLTGGAAGVPAWFMAFVSLSLSVFSLFMLYPIMYKVYHQDADDMLGHEHIEALVVDTILETAEEKGVSVDWELFGFKERELSIDIMVPYENTEDTLFSESEMRSELLKILLSELGLFRVYKPVQLTVKTVGANAAIDFDTGIGIGVEDMEVRENLDKGYGAGHTVGDYSSFFRDLHMLSRVEEDVGDVLGEFFSSRIDMDMMSATVTSDDRVLFVSIIYKPTTRLAFFRFKTPSENIRSEVDEYVREKLGDLIGERNLVVRVKNQVATFADKSDAGRVERGMGDDDRIAAVARQEGLAGRMLQTKLFGDILSTVEYTANEKREFINKWGFWGLIGFVWIPFMASGVLVGAMLGLLSRMRFMRVLMACIVGGSAASITWAYTAEGIVTVMHKYKLELMIPIAIVAFIGMAVLHMRSTKARRQSALFEDEMFTLFHDNVEEKYGVTDS